MRTVSSRKAALDSVAVASHPTSVSSTRNDECASAKSFVVLVLAFRISLTSAIEYPSRPQRPKHSSAWESSWAVWASRRALALPADDRAYVATVLEQSLSEAGDAISGEALLAELQRRSAACRAGTTSARPAADVLADLRRRQAAGAAK